MELDWVCIGKVRSVHPGRRELRVQAFPGHAHAFSALKWLRARFRDGEVVRCRVAKVRSDRSEWIVALALGVTRENVARLRGATVVLAPDEVTRDPARPWLPADLVGLAVTDVQGETLGQVAEVIELPANDVVRITRADGSVFMLPFIEEVVATVDLEAGTLVVGDIGPHKVEG